MTIDPTAIWILTVGVLIQGVWLTGVTYLMWKRHQVRKNEPVEPETSVTA
ncbi:MAG: hypothetical protein ACE5QF_05420 [Thermoplasmata archaeon]